MTQDLKQKILSSVSNKLGDEQSPEIIEDFHLKTSRNNQLLAFLKPEVFLDKSKKQTEEILDLIFDKLETHKATVNGAAIFPGPAIGKYSIMDKHYGVINMLSKNASKILDKDERDLIFNTLGIKDKNIKILGGHEAFKISNFSKTYDFDKYRLSAPSAKIKSGFYVRSMKVADKETVVVNGFHPHQLAHYTDRNRFLAVMLINSNTSWTTLREKMLGDSFPEKAIPDSIRGTVYKNAKHFGFESVTIANNIMHLSAGPTEALFEIDNFLREPLGIDFIKEEANLAKKLNGNDWNHKKTMKLINDKILHEKLEHVDTIDAIRIIKSYFNSRAS